MPRDPQSLRKLTQPPDWWAAFEAAAEAAGLSLSEWAGQQMRRGLTAEVRKGLSKRRGRGKPPATP